MNRKEKMMIAREISLIEDDIRMANMALRIAFTFHGSKERYQCTNCGNRGRQMFMISNIKKTDTGSPDYGFSFASCDNCDNSREVKFVNDNAGKWYSRSDMRNRETYWRPTDEKGKKFTNGVVI
jgi:hypothetical protein